MTAVSRVSTAPEVAVTPVSALLTVDSNAEILSADAVTPVAESSTHVFTASRAVDTPTTGGVASASPSKVDSNAVTFPAVADKPVSE